MPSMKIKRAGLPLILSGAVLTSTPLLAQDARRTEPLVIQDQGSFTVGGTVTTAPDMFDPRKPLTPEGQTFHGDHLYAFYQLPVNPRPLPIVRPIRHSRRSWVRAPQPKA